MAAADAPTGCFKCGRTGHWSSDCPFQQDSQPQQQQQQQEVQPAQPPTGKNKKKNVKQQKPRRGRPKLTADMLLSDKGLGYVLEKLPHTIRIGGPGHEAQDLDQLVAAYKNWQASLLPSASFKEFIGQVEALGSLGRVKVCLEQLRDKVAAGADLKVDELGGQGQEEEADAAAETETGSKLDQAAMDWQDEACLYDKNNNEVAETSLQEQPRMVMDNAQRERSEANRLKALEMRRCRTVK